MFKRKKIKELESLIKTLDREVNEVYAYVHSHGADICELEKKVKALEELKESENKGKKKKKEVKC